MASMVQNCPPEMLSAICEIIANDDTTNTLVNDETQFKNLKSCSQSCRAFLPQCRQHIFHSILIHDSYNPKERTAEMFTRLLERTPEIADYVRGLRYGMRFHDNLHYGDVVSVLDKLTALKSVVLNVQGKHQFWTEIPPVTKSSLLRLIHLPTLVSLELRYFRNLELNALPPTPNLQSLHLHTITFFNKKKAPGGRWVNPSKQEKEPERPEIIPIDSIRPQEFKIANSPKHRDDSFSMLFSLRRQDGQPLFDFSGLRSVSFFVSNMQHVNLAKAVLSSAPGLQSLEIIGDNYEIMQFGSACIQESEANLSALKYLSFNVYLVGPYGYGIPNHPLPGICEALAGIKDKTSIEVIKIGVSMYFELFTGTSSNIELWGDLERSLTASEWPSLRLVRLEILSYCRGKEVIEKLQRLPETQFQTLSLEQNFKFDFIVSGP